MPIVTTGPHFQAKSAGAWAPEIFYAKIAGVWEDEKGQKFVRVAGKWVRIWPPNPVYSVSLHPTSLVSLGGDNNTGNIYTESAVTVYPRGGMPPYLYDWEYVSGSVYVQVDADTLATTKFFVDSNDAATHDTEHNADWRCKVTETLNNEVLYTANVDIVIPVGAIP